VDPNTHSKIFRRMPSYYQHLVSPYDNREVKLVETNENNTNEDNNNIEMLIENNNNNDIDINNGINDEESLLENHKSNSFTRPKASNSSINDTIYDYTKNKFTSIHSNSQLNILLPLKNKQTYNVVEIRNDSFNPNKNSILNSSIDNKTFYDESVYEIHSRSNSITSDLKEEVLKIPLMELPPTTLPNQQLQENQKSFENISLPSVT